MINDFDYDGDFSDWQKQLDDAGIDYDITNLIGCTYKEINGFVKQLIAKAERKD